MAQSGKTDAGPAPGASGKEADHDAAGEKPAGGHVSGGVAGSTPAPGESKSADPSVRPE